ncbi:MAG: phage Gp37/Gp68 family protein [bacterium]|nr:phage Gp37/Gp68 family protein [bacterium]
MAKSKIEWTESTWNPVTGCTKVSDGCLNCYAEKMANRLQCMRQPNYKNGFELTMHENMLQKPFLWKRPQMIFVNSMSDIFHNKVTNEFILKVFCSMNKANWHIYQLLTKRAERINTIANQLSWQENIWMGVTVESSRYLKRIEYLRTCPAKLKFISFEPLLDDVGDVDLTGIHWVIVGGESGPKSRSISEEWVINLRRQCYLQKVPFFFKQWGGTNKKRTGNLLQGEKYQQMPKNYNLIMKRVRLDQP